MIICKIQIYCSGSRFSIKAPSSRAGDNSPTIRNKRLGAAANHQKVGRSQCWRKEDDCSVGLELIDQIDGSVQSKSGAGWSDHPGNANFPNHKLIWKGKLITRSSCRALCRTLLAEDFPIEICKYFSACFVCANDQEIGEFESRLRESKAAIKAQKLSSIIQIHN